ncbi:hypothetical protein FQA39_LY03082 [Lamprigera yunnana]|nr:hypothetical protein FQA39_LY03082 [Lamprigera yunnana]
MLRFILFLFVLTSAEECENEDYYVHHLSTKTPYRVVANKEDKEFRHKEKHEFDKSNDFPLAQWIKKYDKKVEHVDEPLGIWFSEKYNISVIVHNDLITTVMPTNSEILTQDTTTEPTESEEEVTIDDEDEIEGCEPQKIWMIVRHGTRNPSAGYIEKMKDRLLEVRDLILENNIEPSDHLRHSVLDALRRWKVKLQVADEKKLTHEGENEMLLLAERMQARFPTIFTPIYSNTSYYFRSTSTQRTKLSARYFATGLFGRQTVKDVWFPKSVKHDPTLRFYKLCDRWKFEVKNNPNTLQERRRFENSTHMLELLQTLNAALNLDNELSINDAFLMYLACSFETAWNHKRKSPWCSLFSPQSLKVLEFAEDLKYYYRDGYGYELTYKQACKAFLDGISYFENKSKFPKATIYFTHSGTILKLLAHLGFYKDDQRLKHSHYNKYDHKWRVSKIDAFGSNMALVLFECNSLQKIAVFHQEKVMQLPSGETFIDFNKFKEYYKASINNCSFDQMCAIE